MAKPFFSIIIPTYNRANLITKTLNSVFAQTYKDYEVIVIDNCSTDNTEEVLSELIEQKRIRFIKHDKNYERATSRNTGMENARGDFVTFLDSDDLMYPQNLQDASDHIGSKNGVKFFHNLYELVDPNQNVLYKYRFPELDDPVRAIADGNFLSCIGAFIHRDIYSRYRFDTTPILSGSEDWDFWLRVVADYRPTRINKVNSGVVHHPARTITEIDLNRLRERLEFIVDKITRDPHLSYVYKDHIKRIRVSSVVYMASVANSSHKFREALELLSEARKMDLKIVTSKKYLRSLQIALFKIDRGI
jgi:glycosyltransferase involved in cell wall biosynthesis